MGVNFSNAPGTVRVIGRVDVDDRPVCRIDSQKPEHLSDIGDGGSAEDR